MNTTTSDLISTRRVKTFQTVGFSVHFSARTLVETILAMIAFAPSQYCHWGEMHKFTGQFWFWWQNSPNAFVSVHTYEPETSSWVFGNLEPKYASPSADICRIIVNMPLTSVSSFALALRLAIGGSWEDGSIEVLNILHCSSLGLPMSVLNKLLRAVPS